MKHTMKVYTKSPEHSAYLKARFERTKSGQSFEWAGHRWAYEVTSFDDNGDYDLLYRFDDMPYPEEVAVTADDLTIRDYFAAKAMSGWLASFPASESHPVVSGLEEKVANYSYALADAMLRAREAS